MNEKNPIISCWISECFNDLHVLEIFMIDAVLVCSVCSDKRSATVENLSRCLCAKNSRCFIL